MDKEQIQALIERSKKNDKQAFALLVGEYQTFVFRLAFRLLCNEEDAKDCVQDVFVKVWLNLKKYDRQAQFSTWLYKIACNTCYDKLRQKSYTPANIEAEIASAGSLLSGENIESNLINRELKMLIISLTEELTPKQKLVFMLCDVEGLSTDEVEIITRLSKAKIKSNLYLARKHIRERMDQITQ
ncbi:MAG: sigma-70 family RNA polymerase sigma factor [Dysgonamonadaceae bacterium]|jgi:RNA polymerase sigma-70 factor (ECF subfamily)|nr:sigma-70 family RNA polymerase sigma factor [Dysgonamonadaceae bacterium]